MSGILLSVKLSVSITASTGSPPALEKVTFKGSNPSTGAIAILYETAQALVYQIVPIDFIPINNVIWITGGLFAIAGIVIGFFGSFISIRKYLKMEGNEILGW